MSWAMLSVVAGSALVQSASVWRSERRTRKALAEHEANCADGYETATKALKRLDDKLAALM